MPIVETETVQLHVPAFKATSEILILHVDQNAPQMLNVQLIKHVKISNAWIPALDFVA
jgi:hypothetical protein